MAAFSSRGPTDDGRIKPELVAPGTNILSVRSHQADAGTGWGAFDSNYIFEGGTSMSTPLTAGAAAVAREWLTRIKGVANPSAALIKSVLINGAADMSPGQYGRGSRQEIPSRRPNNDTGWGRVDLKAALDPPAPRGIWLRDSADGLSTGQTTTYQVTVSAPQATAAATPESEAQPHVEQLHIDPSAAVFSAASGAVDPQATTQLVQNGGFENATFAPWDTAGSPLLITTAQHSGAQSALLGDYDNANDQVYQSMAIPAGATTASIDFWNKFDTSEVLFNSDLFCYGIWDETGQNNYFERCQDIGQIGTRDWTRTTYNLTSGELASVAGKPVILGFYVVTDGSLISAAALDDVALNVTTSGGGPTVTPTATPTKTTTPPTGGAPLRVTLAWTDYPGEPSAAKALVNDLDLEIIAPNGARYSGNQGVYTSGQCLRDGKWDACNNVEGIILPQATAGTYTIVVHGAQVPQGGKQPFALVASGNGLQGGTGPSTRPAAFLPLTMRGGSGSALAAHTAPTGTPVATPVQPAELKRDERSLRRYRP
jgi:hypothetical protein